MKKPSKTLYILFLLITVSLHGCAVNRPWAASLDKRVTKAQHHWRASGTPFIGEETPPVDVSVHGRAQNILDRLVYVSPLRGYQIRLAIVNHPTMHAGTDSEVIFMNAQLLQFLWQDESLIAAILAHELGHIVAHHLESQNNTGGIVVNSLSPLLGMVKFGSYISLGLKETMRMQQKAYSRKDEREADAIGAILAYEAGYDPYGLNRFFDNVIKRSDGVTLPKNIPLANYSNPNAAIQAAALFMLHATPLYKTHPPSKSRKRTVSLVTETKSGKMSVSNLYEKDRWLAKIYKTIENRRPKNRLQAP